MKLNLNFQRGGRGWVLRKNPFREGGMDIFWNYTLLKLEYLWKEKGYAKNQNAANSLGKETHLASFNELFSGILMEIRKLVFCKMSEKIIKAIVKYQ